MKTYTSYESLPPHAAYLGSEEGDGSMYESLANSIDRALDPVRFRDENGIHHYFEAAKEQ